jgi:hypothetical protein
LNNDFSSFVVILEKFVDEKSCENTHFAAAGYGDKLSPYWGEKWTVEKDEKQQLC